MKILDKIYYRIHQKYIRAMIPFLPKRQPELVDHFSEIPIELKVRHISRVLIITNKKVINTALISDLINYLVSSNISISIYQDVKDEPSLENVLEAALEYLKTGSQAIIALGGSSAINCAKSVAAKIALTGIKNPKKTSIFKVLKKAPFLIAIPLTAKAGSNLTQAPLLTKPLGIEQQIDNFYIIPDLAVLNPIKTIPIPEELAATSGFDVLTFAIEAYLNNSLDKESEMSLIESIYIIYKTIERACKNDCEEIREKMTFAASLAFSAFSKLYAGYINALAQACREMYNLDHRLISIVLLPVVLRSYQPVINKKLHKLALRLEMINKDTPVSKGAEIFLNEINKLQERLGISAKVDTIKIEDVPVLAYRAAEVANSLYPVPILMDNKELEQILYQIIE